MTTKIEWCDETVNPVVGCWTAGPGCDHCYAARAASRGLIPTHSQAAEGGRWNGRVVDQPKQLERLRSFANLSQPKRIFVGSMTDLGYAFLLGAFSVLRATWLAMKAAGEAGHTIIVLTKRPDQLGVWIRQEMAQDSLRSPPPWLWVLASVWSQEAAERLVPPLLWVPASLHGVSCEPLLGKLSLERWLRSGRLRWVIAGCESGPGRRPAKLSWFRELRDQCARAEAPFFLKQADVHGQLVKMPKLEGRKWSEMPEVDRAA